MTESELEEALIAIEANKNQVSRITATDTIDQHGKR